MNNILSFVLLFVIIILYFLVKTNKKSYKVEKQEWEPVPVIGLLYYYDWEKSWVVIPSMSGVYQGKNLYVINSLNLPVGSIVTVDAFCNNGSFYGTNLTLVSDTEARKYLVENREG